jgi:hypothetical protein
MHCLRASAQRLVHQPQIVVRVGEGVVLRDGVPIGADGFLMAPQVVEQNAQVEVRGRIHGRAGYRGPLVRLGPRGVLGLMLQPSDIQVGISQVGVGIQRMLVRLLGLLGRRSLQLDRQMEPLLR